MFTEVRAYPLEIRDIDTKGVFVAHASVFDVMDSYKSFFDRGSFTRTIENRGGSFPMTKNHDWRNPGGMMRGVIEDETGLLIREGRPNLKSAIGAEIYAGLPHVGDPSTGYYSDMSHGFKTIRARRDDDGFEHKQEVNLFEIAVITSNFGSNPEAGVEQVRMAAQTVRELNIALKTGNEDRFIEEVRKLRETLETYAIPTLNGEEIETASALVKAEGPSLDTRKLHDSVIYLQSVIDKQLRSD
jgi:HK97 family phage prohead protease